MHALTPYGYATVALAAAAGPDWDAAAHEVDELCDLGIDPDHDEAADEAARDGLLDEALLDCPDWPHHAPCDVCGGNGCATCRGTGERADLTPCRH